MTRNLLALTFLVEVMVTGWCVWLITRTIHATRH